MLASAAALAIALPATAVRVGAQGAHAQPRTPYGTVDLAKIKWLQGKWEGASTDEPVTYQKISFANDSTVEIAYYRDPSFTQESGNGRLYLSVGRVYHTMGSNRWVATHLDSDGVFLVPQAGARNNFSWSYLTPDTWTSTMRTGVGGHERLIVYNMRRLK
jgi:hypothetical protein